MIQILVWIIFYLFFIGVVLLVEYWARLFRERDEYRRDELIDFPNIIRERLLFFSGGKFSGYLAMGVGAGAGWALTLFGGLVSPGSARLPDYATGEVTNYFFQSFLFIGILHVTWPSLVEVLRERQISLVDDFMESEVLFFVGLSCALAAMNISIWGVFHDMSFLYCIVNLLVCLSYAGYRLQQFEEAEPGRPDEEY